MERYKEESFISFAERATQALTNGIISYAEWSEILFNEVPYADETLRRCAVCFERFFKKIGLEQLENYEINKLDDVYRAKADLEKERMKLCDEKRELNAEYRNQSRNELFFERLEKAVNGLKPIEIAPCILTSKSEVTGVLVVSDLHYDSNYLLQGIYGEVVNKYDKEICRGRMSKLISMIEADDILMDDLLVVFNGDLLENAIRASSLIKLSQPVVDSTIELAEYLSNWLVALQDKVGVPMKVAVVGGNHSILRPLMSKPIDERENLEKIIHKFIELRLQNQSNIQVEPYGDVYFASLHQNNILFLHGEDADLENTIMYYENYYDVDLDYCIAGHYHRGESKTVGVGNVANKEVIRVPSICGTDTYAKKLRKNARAGATMMLFTESGRDWSKNYCLN